MDHKHLQYICTKLQLGSAKEIAIRVYGGRGGHLMWRVATERGCYCIKQIAPDIDLKNEKNIAKYELSETIAYQFSQQGILAVFAIEASGNRLTIIENTGYLVYPWIEGSTLRGNEVSELHALKIAEITAKLHSINLTLPEIKDPRFDLHSNDNIVNAIEKAMSFKCHFAKALKEKQNLLLTLNANYLEVIPLLKEYSVITHGDIDPLNVIWNKTGEPSLIDWESAKKMNPTFEIVRTSLRFSGGGTDNFSQSIYTNMLHTYERNGGLLNKNHIEAALHALYGGVINWMLYKIEFACTSDFSEERNKVCNEMEGFLMTVERLQALISQLLKIKQKGC